MKEPIHYTPSRLNLLDGEIIEAVFIRDISNWKPREYKRLFGYESNATYIGVVDIENEVVKLTNFKNPKDTFSHYIYNIEYGIHHNHLLLKKRQMPSKQLKLSL